MKKKKQNLGKEILKYFFIVLLCVFCTGLLLFVVVEDNLNTADDISVARAIAVNADPVGLEVSSVAVFLILLIGVALITIKIKRNDVRKRKK